MNYLPKQDPEIFDLLQKETKRQKDGLVMIPSENLASEAVLEALGTPIQNKYAEGYPGKRYYSGNEFVDQIENIAINRALELFGAEHANVQPHSGSGANMAAYMATINPGDKVMGLNLSHGGHLTHGSPVNFSGKLFNFVHYGVDQKTERIDMNQVREIALKERPKMIVSGATAYPRELDFKAFDDIAKEINAYHLSDISHIVGLCLAGVHPNPTAHADIVMTTTTKTLRGPRSAVILCKNEDRYQSLYHPENKKNLAQRIDFAVFPTLQGGPLEHVIAAKAVAFKEAMTDEFRRDQIQTKKNAIKLAEVLNTRGLRLVSGGTDNHLVLADCTSIGITGAIAQNALEKVQIYGNKNTIPFETRSPFDPSGLRLGTPALSSRGMKETEMEIIGNLIMDVLTNIDNQEVYEKTAKKVKELTSQFPIYQTL